MRLTRLQLQNFRQHADSLIEFDSGLTGIIGINGAGKTTILEAIAWALYGNSAARSTRDTIRFTGAPARAPVRVELDFELGGHRYRIVRGLTSAELFLDGATVPVANTLTGVTEFVQRRLGMSRTEFFNTYFTGQKELNVMAAMKPAERAQFLSRVLGYEKLRTAQELARERRKLIGAEIVGLKSGMRDADAVARAVADAHAGVRSATDRLATADTRCTAARVALDAIAPRWAEAQQQRERLQEVLGELRVADSEAAGLARDAERLARETAEIDVSRAELEEVVRALEPLANVGVEFQRMEELFREEGRRSALLESERALVEELGRLEERLARISRAPELEETATHELERARQEHEQTEATLESRRTEWVRDRQEAETKRGALLTQWTELREQRERLVAAGEEGTCPTCQRPLGGHFRAVLDELDSQIQTVEVDGLYYRQRLHQLEEVPPDIVQLDDRRRAVLLEMGALERRLAKVQLAVQERGQLSKDIDAKSTRLAALRSGLVAIPAGYDAARHRELEADVAQLAALDARAARASTLVERGPQIRAERVRVIGAERALQARLDALRARGAELALPEADVAALREAYAQASVAAQAAEVTLATARSDVRNAEAALAAASDVRREFDEGARKLALLNSERRLHDELDRALSDLRTELNFQLRPDLSDIASAFLTELTDGGLTQLQLDDEYNIVVLEDGVPKPVISGGEEDVAHLVLRLAISQMIAERAGQTFSLLILDEVFGSLDESRRQGVVHLLRHLQNRFEQVILITHIESVRDGLDHILFVRYDEQSGSSRVERQDALSSEEVAAGADELDRVEPAGVSE